jgi:hypothetical protein
VFDENDDLEALKKAQQSAENKKAYLGVAGNVAQTLGDVPSASEIFFKRQGQKSNAKAMFDAAAGAIEDPMERQQKAMAYMKSKREGRMAQADESKGLAQSDPNSPDSLAMQEQIGGIFPQFAKYVQGKSAAQIREMMPILTQKARGDEDRALREQEMRMRNQDRADARALQKDAMQARLDEKAMKQKELNAAQAKQRGVYEMGKKAEEQFANAAKDKNSWDPTSYGEFLDNSSWAPNFLKSDKAIEGRAAQDAWIEAFLRDASGAAIPHSERQAYREQFFPVPGDSESAANNKMALRAQKMENARIGAGIETGHGPSDTMVASQPAMSPKERALAELAKRKAAKQTAGK